MNDAAVDAFVPMEDAGTDSGTDSDGGTDAGGPCGEVVCTALDACHVAGVCDPETGTCSNPVADDETPCDDGLACTEGDACSAGTCVGGGPADDGTLCPCGECTEGACGWRSLGATGTTPGGPYPVSFAVDDARVYVGNSYLGVAEQASVTSIPLAGGDPTALVSGFTGYPSVVLVDGTLYFSRGAEVWSVPADGSAAATSLYTGAAVFNGITSDGVRLYLTSFAGNSISSLELDGTFATLASGEAGPLLIVTDGTRLYWINSGDATIRAMPVAGGAAVTIATGTQPQDLAVDATHVYWTEGTAGEVLKAPLAGGASVTIATGQAQPTGIMVLDARVYWTNNNGGIDGSVMSAPVEGGEAVMIGGGGMIGPSRLTHHAECIYVLTAGEVETGPAF